MKITYIFHHENLFKLNSVNTYTMNKWLGLLIGLVLVVVTVYFAGMNTWGLRYAAITVFKGMLIWIVFFVGLLLIILGISDLKD